MNHGRAQAAIHLAHVGELRCGRIGADALLGVQANESVDQG